MKVIRWILFFLFCFFILWTTLLKRTPNGKHSIELGLFWSYRLLLSGDSYGKVEVKQNIQNVLFFIPFGILIPTKQLKIVFISALSLSFLIELLQYICCLGLAEIDDVICNTIGAIMGFCFVLLIRKKIINKVKNVI